VLVREQIVSSEALRNRYVAGMSISRRSLLLSLPALALASPAFSQRIPLNELSRYFNSFTTAQGDFTQINPDGSISTGRMYMRRPGRVRFEYNPPEQSLVMAGGGQVAVFDGRSNQGPNQYPLRQTPLNLILEQTVDFSNRRMIVGHTDDGTTTTVVAQDPDNPQYGSIRLIFSANPTELRQWVIRDDTGAETTVILGELTFGTNLAARLFNITAETEARRR
jgi:outer membrane lipoprotein-sorting protein